MAIDNCSYSFDELASQYLPRYFRLLEAKRGNRISSDLFLRAGHGYRRTMRALQHEQDFRGCDVFFFEDDKPVYVGISQNVITRIWNHFNAVSHHTSSLVYKVACEAGVIQNHRADYTGQAYREEFERALQKVQGWTVIYQEIPDHVSLYLFEVYAAMRYDTSIYNTFQTH